MNDKTDAAGVAACHLPGCPHGAECVHAKPSGVAPTHEAQRLAMEACRLLCAAAVVQENPDKVVCPPAFVVAVRAAMLALRADGVMASDAARVQRLRDALEGECAGLSIDEHHARAVLEYVDGAVGINGLTEAETSATASVMGIVGVGESSQAKALRDPPEVIAAEYDRMVMRAALRQIAAMDPKGQRADDLGRAARVARDALADGVDLPDGGQQ